MNLFVMVGVLLIVLMAIVRGFEDGDEGILK